MPAWSPPALVGAVLIAVHFLLLRAASGRVSDRLGALVLETAATVGVAVSFALGARGAPVTASRAGVLLAAASGLAVSMASILIFTSLRKGGPVAATGTMVLGGGVALSAFAAPLLFGESFTLRRALGIALGLAAMWVLGGES